MISCAFCGRPNTDESRFCIDCGKPVGTAAANAVPAIHGSTAAPGATPARAPHPATTPSGAARRRRSSPGGKRQSGGAGGSGEPAYAIVPPTRINRSGALRTATCGWCGNPVDPGLPFCAHCGRRTDAVLSRASSCASCGASVLESDAFCGACGTPTAPPAARPTEPEVRTLVFSAKRQEAGVRLAVLDELGAVKQMVVLTRGETIVGRGACDLSFADDPFLSPLHAQFVSRDGALFVRDLGSHNRTWVFIDTPFTLGDDEVLLVGSQVCRVRRVGSPAAPASEGDGTRHMGSATPGSDVALIAQLRGDGSLRDVHYLAAGAAITLGRDTGTWTFPYDQTMSARHAEIRDEDGRLVIRDLGSRNGIALAVRGEHRLAVGQRVLVGDQVLRVESL